MQTESNKSFVPSIQSNVANLDVQERELNLEERRMNLELAAAESLMDIELRKRERLVNVRKQEIENFSRTLDILKTDLSFEPEEIRAYALEHFVDIDGQGVIGDVEMKDENYDQGARGGRERRITVRERALELGKVHFTEEMLQRADEITAGLYRAKYGREPEKALRSSNGNVFIGVGTKRQRGE